MRHANPKDMKRREVPQPNFGSFLYVFSPPPGPALCKLGWPAGLFVLPEVLSPQTFLCSIFLGFPLPCLLATANLDSFFLF